MRPKAIDVLVSGPLLPPSQTPGAVHVLHSVN